MERIIDALLNGDIFPPELIVSLVIMVIILIFSLIVFIKAKRTNPLEKPHGIMLIAEYFVEFIDNLVATNMGPQFKKIGGAVFGFICPYLFLAMIAGLFGVPSPITMLYMPLSLGIISFLLIHAVSAYYTHWKYFQRYIDPFPVMLPINLLSMWAPLLSLTFRLFGNAIAGYVIMNLFYWAFENIFTFAGGLTFAPIITPIFHAYFDVFSGFIQTTVFTLLSMALIKNEVPLEISTQLDKEYKESIAIKNRIDNELIAMSK
ncbi:MAG: F0F1 ATP synthase subunit A [Bacillales bacterium]|nr:F0F1 ATP synthase subunit A [Bacillales bacterium]